MYYSSFDAQTFGHSRQKLTLTKPFWTSAANLLEKIDLVFRGSLISGSPENTNTTTTSQ